MKQFMNEDFLLHSETAKQLYQEYVAKMPIIDYHCHINPMDIANNLQFENLTQAWLYGDHYKWRALRANGISEEYCTGNASDYEKFEKWASTIPFTMRNPLYHWTHLELKRYFNINKILNANTAKEIYEEASAKLRSKDYSVKNLMRKMNVELVCTTDDPVDSLEYHRKIQEDGFEIRVLPAWRPDNAMKVENSQIFNQYLAKLAEASDITINNFQSLIEALRKRHLYFNQMGSRLSDHGLDTFYADPYTENEISAIFRNLLAGKEISFIETKKFKSAMLYEFALMDYERGWTQQFHVGALRNNNSLMYRKIGADSGYDSIGDEPVAVSMSRFFDRLCSSGKLAKTIVYNLNPSDNAIFATMIANFQDGSLPGKMQWGSGWWFLDQKKGIEEQLNTLSVLGLLSRFVGMLTDSRSFLSYPRHEYFRRILCNLIGNDVENGELPADKEFLGQMVKNISYYNAKEYFKF
jgi:glucuronate isomerase